MPVKLIGTLLLLLAGIRSAISLSGYERRRITVLDGYITLLRRIRGQIDSFAMPIDVILRETDPAVLDACRGHPSESGRLPPTTVGPALRLDDLLYESRRWLGPECERLLMEFSAGLGRSFRREQVSRCDVCLSALSEQRRRLADSLPMRVRTGCTLLVTVFLTAAVLLW